jgi:murein DD-endopeptidase MepM/ murein hydrolase activator NlpD
MVVEATGSGGSSDWDVFLCIKLDMQVKTLSLINRVFCSVLAHRFNSTRREYTAVLPPKPPQPGDGFGGNVTSAQFGAYINELQMYLASTFNPRLSLINYLCTQYGYRSQQAEELIRYQNAPYKEYPSGNASVDKTVLTRIIQAASKHYHSPSRYDYLGNSINKTPSELWPRKDSGWNTYADHGGYREIGGVMTGNLASDLPLKGQEGRPIMAAYDGTVVETHYNFPGTLRKWGSQWYYDDVKIGEERVDALYPGIYQHTITSSDHNWTWGNHILIKYDNVDGRTLYFHYAHIRQSPQLAVGKMVRRGDIIGNAGTTGHSTGTHIHLEVWTSQSYLTRLPVPHQYLP